MEINQKITETFEKFVKEFPIDDSLFDLEIFNKILVDTQKNLLKKRWRWIEEYMTDKVGFGDRYYRITTKTGYSYKYKKGEEESIKIATHAYFNLFVEYYLDKNISVEEKLEAMILGEDATRVMKEIYKEFGGFEKAIAPAAGRICEFYIQALCKKFIPISYHDCLRKDLADEFPYYTTDTDWQIRTSGGEFLYKKAEKIKKFKSNDIEKIKDFDLFVNCGFTYFVALDYEKFEELFSEYLKHGKDEVYIYAVPPYSTENFLEFFKRYGAKEIWRVEEEDGDAHVFLKIKKKGK